MREWRINFGEGGEKGGLGGGSLGGEGEQTLEQNCDL